MFPRTRSGRASRLLPGPWHNSGRMLALGHRTAPEAAAVLHLPELPPGGRFNLRIGDSPVEELTRLEPGEPIAGYWREVAMFWRSGITLERNNLAAIGDIST